METQHPITMASLFTIQHRPETDNTGGAASPQSAGARACQPDEHEQSSYLLC
ncbi:hypothetical protein LTR60_001770, partial [Cryomyces antarcticus]